MLKTRVVKLKKHGIQHSAIIVIVIALLLIAYISRYDTIQFSVQPFEDAPKGQQEAAREDELLAPTGDIICKDGGIPDAKWQQAYKNPRLCRGTFEHGIFNLRILKQILDMDSSCGAYCIFIPSSYISPPMTSIGWALIEQGQQQCWQEIGSFDDGCMSHYVQMHETNAPKLPEIAELGKTAYSNDHLSKASTKETCDPVLTKEDGKESCGPRVLIIGAMKCATNAIGSLLALHPDTELKDGPQRDVEGNIFELNYFSHHAFFNDIDPLSLQGRELYADLLPAASALKSGKITFDKSPSYLDGQWWGGQIPRVAKKLLPNARVIVSVCNPTERFHSQYWHSVKEKLHKDLQDIKSFAELVNEILDPHPPGSESPERKIRRQSLTALFYETGLYAPHILDWYDAYGSEAVQVVTLDEVAKDPYDVARRVVEHAGLDWSKYPTIEEMKSGAGKIVKGWGKMFSNTSPGYDRSSMPMELATKLKKAYAPSVRWLAELTGNGDFLKWNE